MDALDVVVDLHQVGTRKLKPEPGIVSPSGDQDSVPGPIDIHPEASLDDGVVRCEVEAAVTFVPEMFYRVFGQRYGAFQIFDFE